MWDKLRETPFSPAPKAVRNALNGNLIKALQSIKQIENSDWLGPQ